MTPRPAPDPMEEARGFLGCDADGHSDGCASSVEYAEDENGCDLLAALLTARDARVREEEREAACRDVCERCRSGAPVRFEADYHGFRHWEGSAFCDATTIRERHKFAALRSRPDGKGESDG